MKPLPDVFAALIVSVDEWSLAAGRTFERRELRAVDVVPAPLSLPLLTEQKFGAK